VKDAAAISGVLLLIVIHLMLHGIEQDFGAIAYPAAWRQPATRSERP
jgi:hypothetical protein